MTATTKSAKSYASVSGAKRAASMLFGKDWAERYEIVAVNPESDDDGFDIRLLAPSIGDVVQAEREAAISRPETPAEDAHGDSDEPEGDDGEGDTTDVEASAEGEEPASTHAFKGDRLKARKAQYVGHKHCGDEVAQALAGVDTADVLKAAASMGVDVGRWSHLNNGQQRMNCGNVLRTMVKKADDTVRADILTVLRGLPRRVEVRVLRNGRPFKRCVDQAEADAFITEMLAKVKEGDTAPQFKTEDVVAA